MHVAADPVADERADDREAVGLDALLDRVRDVAEVVARAHLLDRVEQRRLGRVEQALRIGVDVARPPTVIAASATQPS